MTHKVKAPPPCILCGEEGPPVIVFGLPWCRPCALDAAHQVAPVGPYVGLGYFVAASALRQWAEECRYGP